jgi:hypothetical protein
MTLVHCRQQAIYSRVLSKKYCTYGYIAERKLNICSENRVFVALGKRRQYLLTGLLTDVLVESAFIQIDFEEMKAGLDLHYIDLLVVRGTESEVLLIQQSDLISQCNKANVLINPAISLFQDAVNEFPSRRLHYE